MSLIMIVHAVLNDGMLNIDDDHQLIWIFVQRPVSALVANADYLD